MSRLEDSGYVADRPLSEISEESQFPSYPVLVFSGYLEVLLVEYRICMVPDWFSSWRSTKGKGIGHLVVW